MTVPGSDSIVETVDLLKSKLNILGYEQKVDATGKLGKWDDRLWDQLPNMLPCFAGHI